MSYLQREMADLARFLAQHDLPISATTLAIGWTYLSGGDRVVSRTIDRQVRSMKPVTLAWLNDQFGTSSAADEEFTVMTELMQRLEGSIEEFSHTSRDAHTATTQYHTALEGHVNDLDRVARTDDVIINLANITKVMLKRTRDIERQMLRSEAQTRALKRRLDEARRSAEEDHLTGLPNRRAFESRFEAEFREARAASDQLCVAFCDIDNFKRINDEHGHEAGDRVLKLVAENLARLSNDRCHVARHGGEEFVVLLRGEKLEAAAAKLDLLRTTLSERRLVNRANDRPFGQVTFSAGIADVFVSGDTRHALKAADTALYRAKTGGRNRVEIATPADALPAGFDAA